MNYLSVCSGIEAATVAWHPLGWKPIAFSEIERFPSEVLAHHYPQTPNLGDMTKFKEWNLGSNIDVFVGGTPCQSFSVAGLRKGLDDPRGNLMLTYLAIADKFRPRWLVWENVPGVLSSNGGKDFGTFLGGLGELGYGFAYRVLDAQYFGVAQRRRRVFVVGYLGDWRPAAAILFERHSLSGNPAPRREKRQGVAGYVESSFGQYRQDDVGGTAKASGGVAGGGSETFIAQPSYGIPGNWIGRKPENGGNATEPMYDIAPCLTKTDKHGVAQPIVFGMDGDVMGNAMGTITTREGCISDTSHAVAQAIPIDSMNHLGRKDHHSFGDFVPGAPSFTLTKGHSHAVAQPLPFKETADCLTASYGTKWNGNASADNGSLFVSQPISVLGGEHPNAAITENLSPTLTEAMGAGGGHIPIMTQPIGTDLYGGDAFRFGEHHQDTLHHENGIMSTLPAGNKDNAGHYTKTIIGMAVRRLTPVECERLQGFPDNYTDIKTKGKPTPDGPRYKALGNSMAVPVMRWIGERIQSYEFQNER